MAWRYSDQVRVTAKVLYLHDIIARILTTPYIVYGYMQVHSLSILHTSPITCEVRLRPPSTHLPRTFILTWQIMWSAILILRNSRMPRLGV